MSATPDRTKPDPLPAIVMVDDEAGFAEVLKTALSGRFSVRSTTSPSEAVALCSDSSVRILLTDFLMEEMDGSSLVRTVRSVRQDIDCILFSGALTTERWLDAVNAGCSHILTKPLSLKALIDICTGLLTEDPGKPERGRDPRSSGEWRSSLGTALRSLLDHLEAGKSPVLALGTSGGIPTRVLRLFIPGLEEWTPDAPAPRAEVLHLNLDDCGPELQEMAAPLIASRRQASWILSARSGPDEMLESGRLCEALYMRIGSSVIEIPEPGECPEDALLLCSWYLEAARTDGLLSARAAEWLNAQFSHLDWHTVFAMLDESLSSTSVGPIGEQTLQRASLSATLGTAVDGLESYPEFVVSYAREMRAAWDMLGRLPQ